MVNSVTGLGGSQIIAQNHQPPTLNSNQKNHITRLFQDIVHGPGVTVGDLQERLNAVNINVAVGLKALVDEIDQLKLNDIGSLKPQLEQVSNTLRTLQLEYESNNNLQSRNSDIIGGSGRSQIQQIINEVRRPPSEEPTHSPILQIINEVGRP
ncbi:MAG: hypothetical protein ING18_06670 [Burkholderiales bacterium]|nr:hypothetical protein [Burkholderiales bacterium]MCA3153741.1 hypothetical protein [Burkholderiales bacterium]MCA3157332.1 hypothetical protein [Burkholderiales bacterium]MCA3168288.1 hypothetical protein [Burkholderiales bacterium]